MLQGPPGEEQKRRDKVEFDEVLYQSKSLLDIDREVKAKEIR